VTILMMINNLAIEYDYEFGLGVRPIGGAIEISVGPQLN
jgi:hypothetical protein